MKEIADRIRQVRIDRGLTQDELAKACGYKSRSSIYKIEADAYDPGLETIKKIARALNVDPDYLVFGDTESTMEEIQRLFSSLDEKQQEAVLTFLRSMTASK